MKLRALFGGLALSLFLALGASPVVAQDLYVSNRPFKGEVTKAGSGLMVEVEPLAKALKLEVVVSDGQVKIKDRSVPVTVSASGKNLVILDQFAAAAGLTVRKNPDFGHTDVYANTTAPSGDWAETEVATDEASGSKGKSISGNVQSNASAGYSVKVPSDYQMLNDPSMMQAIMGAAAQNSGSKLPEGMVRAEFVLTPKQGTPKTGAIMLMTMQMPGPIPAKLEPELAKGVTEAMAQRGQLISGPTTTAIGGKKFTRSTLKAEQNGKINTIECNIHMALSKGRVYMLMLIDEEVNFPKSSPELHSILETFKVTI